MCEKENYSDAMSLINELTEYNANISVKQLKAKVEKNLNKS